MRDNIVNRNDIFKYAEKNFCTKPEYKWIKFPNYAILKHPCNLKWYAVIMDVSKQKLGLQCQEYVDILNVKCNPIIIGSLLNSKGYLPAYHMNKEHWITILLNGSVEKKQIFNLLSLSFELTQKNK